MAAEAATTPSPLKRSRSAGQEQPPVPDVGQPWGESGGDCGLTSCRDDELPPIAPGMKPALKPSAFNMDRLHRSKVPSVPRAKKKRGKANYKGLPVKYALGVPLVRKYIKDTLDSLAPEAREELATKSDGYGHYIRPRLYGVSKYLAWLCRTAELSHEQLCSSGELHMKLFTRRIVMDFKKAMDARRFKASTMRHILYGTADYVDACVVFATHARVHIKEEATLAARALRALSHRYSKYAKRDSIAWKRAADLNAELGTTFHQSQVQSAFSDTLLEAMELLGRYDMRHAEHTIPVLQHPASTLRTVQTLLIALVSLSMCVPRDKVIENFKLVWLAQAGNTWSINPGEDQVAFKTGVWRAGSVLIRPELAAAIQKYTALTWPRVTGRFTGGRGRTTGGAAITLSSGTRAAREVVHALRGHCTNQALFSRLREQSPVFWAGVPDALDDTAASLNSGAITEATALCQASQLLLGRLRGATLPVTPTNESLKYVFVSWLKVYESISQNSARHLATWWMYQEWHEQIEYDIQGFPNQFIGKSYHDHVKRAADMMNHSVDIHEATYLPVSPSHQTVQEEEAVTAAAQPLVSSSTASTVLRSSSDDEDEDSSDYSD